MSLEYIIDLIRHIVYVIQIYFIYNINQKWYINLNIYMISRNMIFLI